MLEHLWSSIGKPDCFFLPGNKQHFYISHGDNVMLMKIRHKISFKFKDSVLFHHRCLLCRPSQFEAYTCYQQHNYFNHWMFWLCISVIIRIAILSLFYNLVSHCVSPLTSHLVLVGIGFSRHDPLRYTLHCASFHIKRNNFVAVRPFLYMTTTCWHPWNCTCLKSGSRVQSFENKTFFPAV